MPHRSLRRSLPFRVILACLFVTALPGATAQTTSPQRVVSASPNLTETIFALGAGDRLVGVSDFCHWPPPARELPRIGGWSNPAYERITELQPDLIVVLGRHESLTDFARRRGIPVAQVQMMNVGTIRSGILELGRLLGRETAATSLTASIDLRLAAFEADLAAHPDRPRPRVFISSARTPGSLATLFTVGGNTFLDEALRLAGGVNVYNDVEQPFPQVSKESLMLRRPEIIIELEAGIELSDDRQRQLVADWRPLAAIPAVRDGRIHVLTGADLLIAGPRLPELIEQLRRVILPSGEGAVTP
jgi:iron complex transport system substrate-binding protein